MGKRAGRGMSSLPGLPSPGPKRIKNGVDPGPTGIKSGVDPMEELVGAICDSIIVYPSGWEDTIPERWKNELPMHRLIHVSLCNHGKAEWDEATDLEAMLYMYPASLDFPLGEQWSRIYLHLGTKVMGDKFPEDLREETLSAYDEGALRDLKRWIQKKKVEARKARRRQEKAQDKERKAELEPAKYEMMRLL
ncbi:hypothetical protein LCGC14_1598380 [marine sediment metagenome]|uniref:Uncharacterized protein n=1 Tax=marine sediment metagenome TaxID=412755 RepID=A0A0F9IYB8_9ZZZZ